VIEGSDKFRNPRHLKTSLARLGAPRAAVDPADVQLMKPTATERPFSDEGWVFELKYDGFRMLAAGGSGEAHLSFEPGRDATPAFPEIARSLAALPFRGLVLDGEVVVLDAQGRPNFQQLQRRVHGESPDDSAVLFAFDLLACEGFDLRPLPLRERKALLGRVLAEASGPLRPAETVPERGEDLYAAVRQLGLEGIVGKRLESSYRGGYSADWLKVHGDRSAPARGQPVRFTHLDKELWPGEGITKGELIDYYETVSPWMLPLLADRPLVLERYPHGVGDLSFIQKSAPPGLSKRLRTVAIPAEDGRTHDYVLCDDVDGLLELVNLATIPFHVWSSRVPDLDRPDWCILDLDPKTAPFAHVVTIARALRGLCEEIELPSHVKTSGGSGLHVLLPTGGRLDYGQCRQLAELLARVVVGRWPAIATTARSLRSREGKVYLDTVQNGRGRLLAAPYTARPRPGATVSTPLDWSEVDDALDVRAFNLRTVPSRLAQRENDPLLPILDEQPDLDRSLQLLGERVA
jgi:bifunctional non-homologous end joining protein LigD